MGSVQIADSAGEHGDGPMGAAWIQANPSAGPSAREGHAIAYDSSSGRTIMYGGRTSTPLVLSNETWAYDAGANSWLVRQPRQTPGPLTGHAMAHDAESGRTILFGGLDDGRNALARTWAYDDQNDTWTSLNPPNPPPARAWHAMAYDARSDVVVLFGGWPLGPPEFNDTWAYDFNSNTWSNVNPATHPSGRIGHAMAYDSESDRIILFGGGINPYSDETWAYDYDQSTWTKMDPSTYPTARFHHAMAYADGSDRAVLFGGIPQIGSVYLNDTWAYDFETDSWADLAPSVAPSPRFEHRIAYDTRRGCLVLFGGGTQTSPYQDDETWWYPGCTGPTRSAVDSIDPYWHASTPLLVTASAADSEVTSVTLWYRFRADGAAWGSWTGFGTLGSRPWSWSFSFPDGEGHYEFYTTAADVWGNEESPPPSADAGAGYDATPPASTVLPISPYWHDIQSVAIEANASDALSGVASLALLFAYAPDNATWGPWITLGTETSSPWSWTFPFPDGEGNYVFHTIASDVAGNVEGTKASAEAVAGYRILPDYVPASPSPISPLTVGMSASVTFSLDVTNIAGNANATAVLAFANRTAPGSPFATFPIPALSAGDRAGPFWAVWMPPPTPGTYDVVALVDVGDMVQESDETNNAYAWAVTAVPGPVTSLEIGAPSVAAPIPYVTSATPLSLSVLDQSGTGTRATVYRIDGGVWIPASAPFTLAIEGERFLEWYSEDNAGNVEAVRSATLRVDDTPPATTLPVGNPKHVAAATFVTSSTRLSLAAADGGVTPVGIAATEVRIDGGPWIPNAAPFSLKGEGRHVVEFRSMDRLGNEEPIRAASFVVDDTPPITTPSHADGTYPPGTAFAFTATDAGSGVARMEIRVDGGWTTFAAAFTLPEGPHTIGFRSVDYLNNSEAERILSITISSEPPPPPPLRKTNWKPIVAAAFASLLALLGAWSARRAPWPTGSRRRWRAFAFTALPFVVAEAGTGVVSLLTSLLAIPPLIGAGTTVDLGILLTGIGMSVYRVRRLTSPK